MMDSLRVSTLVIPLLIVVAILFAAQRYLAVQRDAREPPFIYSKLPFIGHILGLMRNGSDYYYSLDTSYKQNIYALPMLQGRMYMVTSPDWAIAIHRAHKTLYFNTLIAQAIKKLFLFDKATMDIINQNLNGENGNREGIMLEIHHMMNFELAPGPRLDEMNKTILNSVAADVNDLAGSGPQQVRLWHWIRHHFSIASIGAFWGPNNPFKVNPEIENAFWEFEANSMSLVMLPYPQLLARKGHLAREKLFQAFYEYMQEERYKDPGVCELVKRRAEINLDKYQLSTKMHAYGEVSLVFGALVNTIPIAFWLISWIFEDPSLLSDIRDEVEKCISYSAPHGKKATINPTRLRSSCPLFSSTFRETLRMTASLNSNRFVAEDTTVTNHTTGESYLLKKDSVVQIASNVIHFKSLWGKDAETFNPRRFLPTGEKAKSEATGENKPQDPAAPFRDGDGKVHGSAFRSFGGGNNVCPGRYFAQTEVMGLASLFIVGFEMNDASGGGTYRAPPLETFKTSMNTVKPGRDVEVILRRRKGYEDVEWQFAT